jgi:hypothetical protein
LAILYSRNVLWVVTVYYCVMYCKVLDKQQDRKKCKEIRNSQFREIRKPTSN